MQNRLFFEFKNEVDYKEKESKTNWWIRIGKSIFVLLNQLYKWVGAYSALKFIMILDFSEKRVVAKEIDNNSSGALSKLMEGVASGLFIHVIPFLLSEWLHYWSDLGDKSEGICL